MVRAAVADPMALTAQIKTTRHVSHMIGRRSTRSVIPPTNFALLYQLVQEPLSNVSQDFIRHLYGNVRVQNHVSA